MIEISSQDKINFLEENVSMCLGQESEEVFILEDTTDNAGQIVPKFAIIDNFRCLIKDEDFSVEYRDYMADLIGSKVGARDKAVYCSNALSIIKKEYDDLKEKMDNATREDKPAFLTQLLKTQKQYKTFKALQHETFPINNPDMFMGE